LTVIGGVPLARVDSSVCHRVLVVAIIGAVACDSSGGGSRDAGAIGGRDGGAGRGDGGQAAGGSGGQAAGGSGGQATGGSGGAAGLGGAGGQAGAGSGGQGGCIPQGSACTTSSQCCSPAFICAGTCMTGVSDRNAKRDFSPADRDEILAALARLPISTWTYKDEASRARHIGPMAQDFKATFHVGSSDKVISQVDADGVALAALQALSDRVNRLSDENAALRRELAAVRARLARKRPQAPVPSP